MTKVAPSKPRVLVVDDEAAVLFTYRMILEQQGYEVTAAATSREAMKAIETTDFDLVLCDFSLEQQHTGFEVIEAARVRRPDLPSVLLTGYASIETADSAKHQNIKVLFKPIDIQEFLGTTNALLRNENEPAEDAE
jgi:DNA-binding NtrC family response regulator